MIRISPTTCTRRKGWLEQCEVTTRKANTSPLMAGFFMPKEKAPTKRKGLILELVFFGLGLCFEFFPTTFDCVSH